jgi:hypothetical protein
MNKGVPSAAPSAATQQISLSYKFQRLRERLREALASGDLAGKLPGERALAKRFHVNAKTLSKALTDLAAEGLLDRSIGRGTYVKGSAPAVATAKRWLVLCDPEQVGWDLVRLLRQAHSDLEVCSDGASRRPSFLNQFSTVIVLASEVSDSFIRNLVVRNIPVVIVGHEPKTYSTHAVLFDGPLAVSQIARDLLLAGHRRLAAVEPAQCTVVSDNLRRAALRYAPDASIESCFAADAAVLAESGITAFVCHSVELASQVKEHLQRRGLDIPRQVSVAAIGSTPDAQPVSGYFMHRAEKAAAIVALLRDNQARPTTIWLAGKFVDRGTMGPVRVALPVSSMAGCQGASI